MKRWFKQTLKRAYGVLIPRGARNSLRLWTLFDAPDRAPRLIEEFTNDPVLILAPHMDDEVIGCGGAAPLHVLAGAAVSVVFLTDGRQGDPHLNARGLSQAELAKKQDELVDLRKDESRAAAAMLGLGDLVFLDGPDGSLSPTDDLVQRLARAIEEKSPRFVYLPAVTDLHPDHWATNRIFHAALARIAPALAQNITVRGYEVWTPLLASAMVDIGSVLADKMRAIAAFASQTRFVDYARISGGLSAYRSMMHLHGRGDAEAYAEYTVPQYRKLFSAISLKQG